MLALLTNCLVFVFGVNDNDLSALDFVWFKWLEDFEADNDNDNPGFELLFFFKLPELKNDIMEECCFDFFFVSFKCLVAVELFFSGYYHSREITNSNAHSREYKNYLYNICAIPLKSLHIHKN